MKRRRPRGRIIRVSRSSRRVSYRAFMNSPAWKNYRLAWLNTYDSKHKVRRCYCCGVAQADWHRPFDLHHRTYERFGGGERYDDLVLVCSGRGGCHPKITKAWRTRHETGLTMDLWQLTDHYRDKARGRPRLVPALVEKKAPAPVVVRMNRSRRRAS